MVQERIWENVVVLACHCDIPYLNVNVILPLVAWLWTMQAIYCLDAEVNVRTMVHDSADQ